MSAGLNLENNRIEKIKVDSDIFDFLLIFLLKINPEIRYTIIDNIINNEEILLTKTIYLTDYNEFKVLNSRLPNNHNLYNNVLNMVADYDIKEIIIISDKIIKNQQCGLIKKINSQM